MQKKMPSNIFQQRFEPIDPILTLAGSSQLQPLDPTTQDVPQIDVRPEPPKSPEHPKSMVKELTQSKRELVVTNFGLGSNKLKEIHILFEGKKQICFLKNDVDRYNLVVDKMLNVYFHLTNKCELDDFLVIFGSGGCWIAKFGRLMEGIGADPGTKFGGEWGGVNNEFQKKNMAKVVPMW